MNPGKAKISTNEKQTIASRYGGTYPEIINTMFHDGKHPNEIAEIFNMSDTGVYYQLKKFNDKLMRRGSYKLSEEAVVAIYKEPGYPKDVAIIHGVARSTAADIKRPTIRYRWILEKHGLIERATEKPKKNQRACLKCDRKFESGKEDFRLCRLCRTVNSRTSEDGIYFPRLSGNTNRSRY